MGTVASSTAMASRSSSGLGVFVLSRSSDGFIVFSSTKIASSQLGSTKQRHSLHRKCIGEPTAVSFKEVRETRLVKSCPEGLATENESSHLGPKHDSQIPNSLIEASGEIKLIVNEGISAGQTELGLPSGEEMCQVGGSNTTRSELPL